MKLAKNKPTVFIYNDTLTLDESMLEDICNIVNNGEVSNLFSMEEKQKIIEDIT